VDFIVLSQCSLVGVGVQGFGGIGSECSENVVRLYIQALHFAVVISKSHAQRLVMQAAFKLLLSTAKWCPWSASFREPKRKLGCRKLGL
jgi:hypothetical protein